MKNFTSKNMKERYILDTYRKIHTNYVTSVFHKKTGYSHKSTEQDIIRLFSTQSHPLGSYSSAGVHYGCWNVAKHMKYRRGRMESMRFYLVHMVSVLALARLEFKFITAYQKVSRNHMLDECLFSSSTSTQTPHLSWSDTQLSMHYFRGTEAVSCHFKVMLQLKRCIWTDLISRLCHFCLSLSLPVDRWLLSWWPEKVVQCHGPDSLSSSAGWITSILSSLLHPESYSTEAAHTHTHIFLQYCYSSHKTNTDLQHDIINVITVFRPIWMMKFIHENMSNMKSIQRRV